MEPWRPWPANMMVVLRVPAGQPAPRAGLAYGSLEVSQVLPPRHAPNLTITLTLSNKISEKKGLVSGLNFLKRLLWSVLLQARLMLVVGLATRDHADICDPCCSLFISFIFQHLISLRLQN